MHLPQLNLLLQKGLYSLNITATPRQVELLGEFLLLLEKWNKVHNITAIRNPEEMVSKHILDSLVVVPYLTGPCVLTGSRILDVGSGAGLPGVPLSILCPDQEFTLLDSNQKKTSFISFAVVFLKLSNIKVIHSRVEQYQDQQGFNVVISRAFASLENFITASAHLCHRDGFFLAMKGKIAQAKKEPLPDGYLLTKIETVTIPGVNGERCLVFVSRKTN
jgi:16S rRNA (guanine527-N7)-methyltransferase